MPDTEPTLIAADAVVPMDPALPKVLFNAGIVVRDGRIAGVGELADLRRQFGDLPTQRKRLRGTLLPGFVNAHTHLELSDKDSSKLDATHFTKWVSSLIASYPPAEQLEATIRAAFRKGLAESLRAGVTTIGDISRHCTFTRDEHGKIAAEGPVPHLVSFGEVVGLGKMRGRVDTLLDAALPPPTPASSPASDSSTGQSPIEIQKSKITHAVSPHAPYTVEGPALRKIVSRAYVRNAPITMHLAELAEEAEFLRHLAGPLGPDWDLMQKMDILDDQVPTFPSGGIGRGGPIRWAQRWGLLVTDKHAPVRTLPVILAHVNYCDDTELAQIAASHVSVAYCPRTHAYFGHPPHRYRAMLAAGINVCLGTDSRASNPDLSVLREAQLLCQRDQFDPYAALEMITRRAAVALGLGGDIGSLSVGKQADVQRIAVQATDENTLLRQIIENANPPEAIWLAGQPTAASKLA